MDINHHHEARTARAGNGPNPSPVTANSQYLATVIDGELSIQKLVDDTRVEIREHALKAASPILLLSPATPSFLAIAQDTSIDLIDIEAQRCKATLKGSARCITAISWSSDGTRLASGTIDGAVQIWDVAKLQPVAQCKIQAGAVRHISWSTHTDGMIAVVSDQGLYLWNKRQPARLAVTFERSIDRLQHLCWSLHHACTLLASTTEGRICVWDFSSVINYIRAPYTPLAPTVSLISQRKPYRNIVFLRWISEQTAAFLYEGGKKFAIVDLRSPSFGSIDWDLGFSHSFQAFDTHSDGEKAFVRVLSYEKQRTYPLPGRQDKIDDLFSNTSLAHKSMLSNSSSPRPSVTEKRCTMSTTPIYRLRQAHDRPGTVEPLQSRPTTTLFESLHMPHSILTSSHDENSASRLQLPARKSSESPMPFLSPAIPAKRPAVTAGLVSEVDSIAPLDPNSQGYFGSFSTTTVDDSDSDDDGFDPKNNKDGSHLLPGGVSVPVPRSCGAVFSYDSTLVVFRPPQKKAFAAKDVAIVEQGDTVGDDVERTARLFPTFGNLFADLAQSNSVMGGLLTYDVSEDRKLVVEALGLDKASYNSRESWKPHSLSTLPIVRSSSNLPTVEVSIRNINDADLLDRKLASRYRILVQPGRSGSAMCLANAAIAIEVGRDGDALTWQTLAKVIEDADTSAILDDNQHKAGNWADHPLGAGWLVRRLYGMAEAHASLQMLACITAVLLGSVATQHLAKIGNMAAHLAIRPATMASARYESIPTLRMISPLTAEFNDVKSYQSSPIKQRTNSALSSRGPSLPTTPKLESSSSTPPWSFTSLTQTSAKLSFSSSVSPENTRSSFSATWKSYTQSVSDKFSSLGTSPPIKKGGLSPNNELSSSLPGASSWTKSVSFASTATTRRSSTFAVAEDDYDSDRTLDDAIAVPSKKPAAASLSLIWKNKDAFSNEGMGIATRPLIPTELLASCRIWTQAYAERLRSWGLYVEAVQFDKIGAELGDLVESSDDIDDTPSSPAPLDIASATCSICFSVIRGLKQLCPACNHAFHMVCLERVLEADVDTFACPTGCECVCTIAVQS